MKKILYPLLGVAVISIASCSTADQKVPQMAADFCNCFSKMERDLSESTKNIVARASIAANPELSIQNAVLALDEEEQAAIAGEMESFSQMDDENSEIGRCIKNVEKKYDKAYTFNQEKFAQKVIKELESKKGCDFTASLLKLGLKMEKESKN
ncbi:MAG: hypothetical protein J0L56_16590 [Chitinophagales bacterium]|nr:hypothetical protein [Chitinophagales bacterium]